MKNKIIKIINKAWNRRWKNEKKTFLHSIRNSIFEQNPALSQNRKDQILITRLRIYHTTLTHQYLFSRTTKPECEQCKTPINVKHLLIYCTLYRNERKKFKLENVNIFEMLNKNHHKVK